MLTLDGYFAGGVGNDGELDGDLVLAVRNDILEPLVVAVDGVGRQGGQLDTCSTTVGFKT